MVKLAPLTSELLDLVLMMQRFRDWKVAEATYFSLASGRKSKINWLKESQGYFNQIPQEYLARFGMCHNRICFDAVMDFKVTPEMMNTEMSELPEKFMFPVYR